MTLPPNPNPENLTTSMINDSRFPDSNLVGASAVAMFDNAHDFTLNHPKFEVVMHIQGESKLPLDILYKRVAGNAIFNDKGRADGANIKCYPGTRVKVINRIERWMDDIHSPPIHWLSAPMGGGKTAIMKTIQESAVDRRGHHVINFFFFRGDNTRNHLHQFFPTLLYQLFDIDQSSETPGSLKAETAKFLSTHPLVLEESITRQCKLLTELLPVIRQSLPDGAQIILLIDGLDECDANAEAREDQNNLLCALEGLIGVDDSPFRLIIASRPEPHIMMAFNQLSLPVKTTVLDENFNPEDDIRKVVIAKFDTIKRTHPAASKLLPDWPAASDVDAIVDKSSGHFIYADTVMRYISTASTLPILSLQRVQGVDAACESPFGPLDSIYSLILSQVDQENQKATHDILAMDILLKGLNADHSDCLSIVDILQRYDPLYTKSMVESLVSALPAIAEFSSTGYIKYYHASLQEFLQDPRRSGEHCVALDSFREKVLIALWDSPGVEDSSIVLNLQSNLFRELLRPTPRVTNRLLKMPFPDWMTPADTWSKFGDPGIIQLENIQTVYWNNRDIETYKKILFRFIYELWSRGWRGKDRKVVNIPYAEQFFGHCREFGWVYKIGDNFRGKKSKSGRKI